MESINNLENTSEIEGATVIPLNPEAQANEQYDTEQMSIVALNEELETLHSKIDDEELSEETLIDVQEKINAIQQELADRESKTAA